MDLTPVPRCFILFMCILHVFHASTNINICSHRDLRLALHTDYKTGNVSCCLQISCSSGYEAVLCERGNFSSTRCRICGDDTYQAEETISTDVKPCEPKRTCTGRLMPLKPGSTTEDTVCTCNHEYGFCHPDGTIEIIDLFLCRRQSCPENFQATPNCDCEPCPPGTHKDKHGPQMCLPTMPSKSKGKKGTTTEGSKLTLNDAMFARQTIKHDTTNNRQIENEMVDKVNFATSTLDDVLHRNAKTAFPVVLDGPSSMISDAAIATPTLQSLHRIGCPVQVIILVVIGVLLVSIIIAVTCWHMKKKRERQKIRDVASLEGNNNNNDSKQGFDKAEKSLLQKYSKLSTTEELTEELAEGCPKKHKTVNYTAEAGINRTVARSFETFCTKMGVPENGPDDESRHLETPVKTVGDGNSANDDDAGSSETLLKTVGSANDADDFPLCHLNERRDSASYEMSLADREKLKKNGVTLLKVFLREQFWSLLLTNDTITQEMKSDIDRLGATDAEKAQRLVALLPSRGPNAFETFLIALVYTKQQFIARELDKDMTIVIQQLGEQEQLDKIRELRFS